MKTKKVEAMYSYMTPPSANFEDMTQPMGPLEQGDQALVDAAQEIPEGEHIVELDDGSQIRIIKEARHDQHAIVQTTRPDGSIEQAGTMITPARNYISADIAQWPAGDGGGRTTHEARGGEVGSVLDPEQNRESSQAIKLEVADKITTARKHLGETGVTASGAGPT